MTKSNEGPNWADKCTLFVVVTTLVCGSVKFLFFDWHVADLHRRQNEVEVAKSEMECLSVVGQVLNADAFVRLGERSVPVCPVHITLENAGETPVRVKKIEFRVFVAPIEDVSALTKVAIPKNDVILVSGVDSQRSEAEKEEVVGVLLSNSTNWNEQVELAQNFLPNSEVIPPGQARLERLHLLAPTSYSSLLTKIEVTVHTEKSKHRWFGFANSAVCAPAAFPSSVSE